MPRMETSSTTVITGTVMPTLKVENEEWRVVFWGQASVRPYGKVEMGKELKWTLSTEEATILRKAIKQVAPTALGDPQYSYEEDVILRKGIAIVEEKFPFAEEPPLHIYQTAKYLVNCAYSPAYVQYFVKMFGENNQEKPVRVMCLDMANEMVSLRCGNLVRSGSRLTNAIAEKYLYSNFHTIEQGFQHEIGLPAPDIQHLELRRPGPNACVAAVRIYNILTSQFNKLSENNTEEYVQSLAAFMHLTDYMQALNINLKAATSKTQSTEGEDSSTSAQKAKESSTFTQKAEEEPSTFTQKLEEKGSSSSTQKTEEELSTSTQKAEVDSSTSTQKEEKKVSSTFTQKVEEESSTFTQKVEEGK